MKNIKKGTKARVTAREHGHEFEIGEIVMAKEVLSHEDPGIRFENDNGEDWLLGDDEFEVIKDDPYSEIKDEKWFKKLLKIDHHEALKKIINDNNITPYTNYERLPGFYADNKAKLLLEYKSTLSKCKTPKLSKKIRIDDTKDTDIIGFETDIHGKGYIVFVGTPYFAAISAEDRSIISNTSFGSAIDNRHNSQKETAKYLDDEWTGVKFYKFKTHKKLFKWLTK